MKKEKKLSFYMPLELSCYVLGFGAFGVFARWMQTQICFDENGLVDKGIWNVIVPVYMIVVAIVLYRFVENIRKEKMFVPSAFCYAFQNQGRVYSVLRWIPGALMCAGALLLFIRCETDKNSELMRVLAGLGFLTGAFYPVILLAANKPHVTRSGTIALLSSFPIVFYALWLVISYKENATNSVMWEYAVEIIALIIALFAFFRIAGFAFRSPDWQKAMYLAMLSGAFNIIAVADERYMGMQIMFIASSGMLVLYLWIMISNLRKPDPDIQEEEERAHGFERL